ncbi:hypothetical protein GQ54DRAFT_296576 [Martensiomyces pterosporus]|nr:hypothetical protein GQ54DRAFT_296576 [Martensiomyces pterosporus]
MAELAFGQPAEDVLSTPFTRHFYPVVGVFNSPPVASPTADGEEPSLNGGGEGQQQPATPVNSQKGLSTPYSRQVARSILRYFRGSNGQAPSTGSPSPPPAASVTGASGGDTGVYGWDAAGPARAPRWQTVAFDKVDDIPRRKSRGQSVADAAGSGGSVLAGAEDNLSPRSNTSELWGEGLLSPKWIAKQQQQRPATVVSLHTLQPTQGGARAGTGNLGGADTLLAEEIARNRICLAAYGLTYTVVVIINRALADEPDTESRLVAIMQRGGLDAQQFAVCRPGTAPQFQVFLHEIERRLYAKAVGYYSDAFMRTQIKLMAIPQLPLPAQPSVSGAVYNSLVSNEQARSVSLALFSDSALVSRYSRFLPLRAWLVRYHFKLALFAECAGDRDVAQRCLWVAYLHLSTYIAEIASGAYLPPDADGAAITTDGTGAPVGWMWALNGGDSDGARSHSLRMFGKRWDEAMELLDAIHMRIVRGWLYQSQDVNSLRSAQPSPASSGGWPYGLNQSHSQAKIAAVHRSGPRAIGRVASNLSAGNVGISASSATGTNSGVAAAVTGGNGSFEPLILSAHAGEASAATEQLMGVERAHRGLLVGDERRRESAVYFIALGSETADVDLVQPIDPASDSFWWWPLGGQFAVLDLNRTRGASSRPGEAPNLALIVNSSLETTGACTMLPPTTQYDLFLTLGSRQCAEHIVSIALILKQSGFGDTSSYFWACISRQYANQAAIHLLASSNGLSFARALGMAASRMSANEPGAANGSGGAAGQQMLQARGADHSGTTASAAGKQLIDSLVGSLRQPLPKTLPSLYDISDVKPAKPTMDWQKGRPRATSTVFTGFAFDQGLGGIYAVVGPRKNSAAASTAASSAAPPARNSLNETSTLSGGSQFSELKSCPNILAETAAAAATGECIFPLWTWPENASPLFHSAALASLQRHRQRKIEDSVYLSGEPKDAKLHMRRFCASPGVENTYAAIWLVSERKVHGSSGASNDTCKLLASALACLANGSAAAKDVAHGGSIDTLIELIRGKSREGADHFYLYLASELAEVYAEIDRPGEALRIFKRLATRFRDEGWSLLTSHALQWVVKCASALADTRSVIEATVEMLSPHLVASDAERQQVASDLLDIVKSPPQPVAGSGEIEVDMTQIYSPITCHAHWRHWRLGDGTEMAYQITLDCQALEIPLQLSELVVQFGDRRFNVHIVHDQSASVSPVDVEFASSDEKARYYDISSSLEKVDGSSSGRDGYTAACNLLLSPGHISVFEGLLVLDDAWMYRGVAGNTLTLQSIAACVDTGASQTSTGVAKLRLCWPTCSPADAVESHSVSAADSVSPLLSQPGGFGDQGDGEESLNNMERLLLGNIGVSRMRDSKIGASGQLSLGVPLKRSPEELALKRAIFTRGPASSLPKNRGWLYVSPAQTAGSGDQPVASSAIARSRGRWLQLPSPPITPKLPSSVAVDAVSEGTGRRISASSVDGLMSGPSAAALAEPAFTVYSRCRVLCLPEATPTASLSVPSVAALAPAYRGEAFPLEIVVKNLHKSKPLTRVSVDVQLTSMGLSDSADSMSELDVGDSSVSARHEGTLSGRVSSTSIANMAGSRGNHARESSSRKDSNKEAAWLSTSEDGTATAGLSTERQQEIRSIEVVPADGGAAIGPKESRTVTVYVQFPSAALSSSWQSSAAGVAFVRCVARYTHDSAASAVVGERWWMAQASAQASIPTTRPLHAAAEPLPSHIVAPSMPPPSVVDGAAETRPMAVSVAANELSGDGEYCFRRPILVTLRNSGPWSVAVERIALRPPLMDMDLDSGQASADSGIPLRIQLAGSTASAGLDKGASTTVAAGGELKHVFWLDMFTSDVIRMPSEICPGTLEVWWHRADSETEDGTNRPGFATVQSRLWMKPVSLVSKDVQVESVCSAPVARVGKRLSVQYRILNPTRAVKSVEASLHAAEGFVFAGPRRTTLNILPGYVGLLSFNMLPVSVIAQQQARQQAAAAGGDSAIVYSPGHVVLGLQQQAAKLGSARASTSGDVARGGSGSLPALSPTASVAGSTSAKAPFPQRPSTAGGSAVDLASAPPSNVAGQGWVSLPRLDIKFAGSGASHKSSSAQQQPPSAPASRVRSPTAPSTPVPRPPPPTLASASSVFGATPTSAGRLAPGVRARAQRTIISLAGLEIPESSAAGDESVGEDAVSGLISPGLASECLDMLPGYFVGDAGGSGGETRESVESDFEDSDQEDDVAPSHLPAQLSPESGAGAILRLDQTSIFCMSD